MIDLAVARLRSNPRFRLLQYDQVDKLERKPLESVAVAPDFYGFLSPPSSSGLPIKSVSRDAALLFLTLREPACVPHLLVGLFGDDVQNQLQQLVLDGIFEIEQGGRFVSGAEAFPELKAISADVHCSRVAQLSADGIAYAAALEGLDSAEIAGRLYMYNRAPATESLQQKFASDDHLISYVTGGSATAKQLESRWIREVAQQSWLMWRQAGSDSRHSFKLYISPSLESLPQAFAIAVDTFVQVKCTHFKLGRTAFGLLRPDKLVAYFVTLEELQRAAELICASVAGITSQGVPFTAAIDADGVASWGMDPPRFDQVLSGQEYQSWRQWVAGRLAVYILAAKDNKADDIPRFVHQRVNLDGIDTATWSPNLAIWRGSAGSDEVVA